MNITTQTPAETLVLFHWGFASHTMAMRPLVRPVTEPVTQTVEIRLEPAAAMSVYNYKKAYIQVLGLILNLKCIFDKRWTGFKILSTQDNTVK
jgi:hypothetical protein